MELEFEVNNQTVTRKDKIPVVDYSVNYLVLKFDFQTTDWSDTAKFVFFKHNEDSFRYALTDNKVTVPSSLLTSKKLIFGLYGVIGDTVRITTNPVIIRLLKSEYPSSFGTNPSEEFSQDEIEEIYTTLLSYYTKTEVDNLLMAQKKELENKIIILESDDVIMTDDTTSLTVRVKRDGFIADGETIKFYTGE